MEMVITPTLCKPTKNESGADVAPLFSGTVTIRVPTMPQAFKFKAKYGRRAVGMDGLSGNDTDKGLAMMEFLAEIAEEIQPFFTAVDLTDLQTNKRLTSVDEFYCYEPSFSVISEVAMKFIQGFAEKE